MKDLKKEFGPSSWAIDNKTAIYVLIFLITVMGLISYNNLPKENFPDIDVPKIFITTQFIGQSPQNVENLVTRQIEKQLKSLKGLKKVTSNSVQNVSIITAEFNTNVEIKDAKVEVKDAVDKAKRDLPQTSDQNYHEPTVSDVNIADLPILYVNVSGDYDLKKLKEYADILKDEIEGYKQISQVVEIGALTPEIQINVDMNKMAAAQVSLADIIQAVGNENVLSSAGNIPMDGFRRTVDIKKDFKNADEVAAMAIRNPKGQAVYLRDIAEIKDSFLEQESFARLKTPAGKVFKNVITLAISKRAGENLIESSDKINALIKEKQKTTFPKGLNITVTGDQSNKTRTTLNDLINTIIIGFILVTVILMFFMGTTNAIFVALSVPLSCFVAFLIMPWIGFTFNMIVLFSFLLALGIVVDDAIVVIENTHRIFANGRIPIKEAAKMAAGEVFLPVFSGTMTTLAPFVPLAFWNSIIGEFMFFLPITLIITLLASLVVAYIMNPVFAVDFMKPHHDGEHDNPKFDKATKRAMIYLGIATVVAYLINFGFGNFMVVIIILYLLNHFVFLRWIDKFQKNGWPRFQDWYARVLERAVKRPVTMLMGTFMLFIVAVVATAMFGKTPEFFPAGDPNFAYVYVTMPIGTDQATTDSITKKIEQRVANVVEPDKDIVTSIISNVTKSVTDPQDEDQGDYPNKGKVTVAFEEFGKRNGKDTKAILTNIRNAVQGFPGVKIAVSQEASGPPVQKDISLEIAGDNLDTLVHTATRLKAYLAKQNIAGIENLVADVESDKPEIVFDIDRERANREGVSTKTITDNLQWAIFGAPAANFRNTKEDDYKIQVRAMQSQRRDIDEIRNLKITYRDMATGGAIRQVPISSFTDVRFTNTFSNIKRKQSRRVLTLSSSVIKPYNANDVNANILKSIANFKHDDTITIRQGGGQEDQLDAVKFLGSALLTSFGLILIILMIQFNSIGKTLIIISEIFFSIIGVLLGCTIFGMTMAIVMTGVGIIALAGVVVRNGILLVEFTDMLIEQGTSLHDAVVEAGHTRMTPVLLTATAAILGLIPLAVGFNIDFVGLFTHFEPHIHFGGDNVAFWGPLAWTMIFGLAFATTITLILVPCMYIIRVNMKNYFFGNQDEKKAKEKRKLEVADASN
ncbi:efflux RND transporter permease subunit [Mucilaginibacter sp.]|uniref:efflux RND transporter permease subunit n=1 Tax=Mucilaginibacter sp. TaxID=1882438 RepID=UPI00326308D1